MMEGSGSVLVTNVYGCGSRRPKNIQLSTMINIRYLNILAGRQPPEVLPVKLLDGSEEHSARRHVQPHGKRLGGEEGFDQPFAEQDLDRFLQTVFQK
jgi:hypothetical protein